MSWNSSEAPVSVAAASILAERATGIYHQQGDIGLVDDCLRAFEAQRSQLADII